MGFKPTLVQNAMECAGNAILSSTIPTNQTYYKWNADSGATSQRHWFKQYELYIVPIKLADNTIVYLAGVGNITFIQNVL